MNFRVVTVVMFMRGDGAMSKPDCYGEFCDFQFEVSCEDCGGYIGDECGMCQAFRPAPREHYGCECE